MIFESSLNFILVIKIESQRNYFCDYFTRIYYQIEDTVNL